METIAFIGIGVMGKSMVKNLAKNGYSLKIYTRTKQKAEDLINNGQILWCNSVKECVKDADIVMSMVGYPKDVEEIYFGTDGIIQNAKKNSYLIDFTTSSPKLAQEIEKEALKYQLIAFDAPVSGGDVGAKNGTLSIMVGGHKEHFETILPILKTLGTNITYTGTAGFGQHTKMANQIALTGAITGVCEAMSYAKNTGLDVETMLKCVSNGAAGSWQMTNMAPRIIKEDFEPGFFIKHYIKDMKIALEEANKTDLNLEMSELVLKMYETLAKEGMDQLGTQALIKYYQHSDNNR